MLGACFKQCSSMLVFRWSGLSGRRIAVAPTKRPRRSNPFLSHHPVSSHYSRPPHIPTFERGKFGAHRKETGPKGYKKCFLANADERPVSCLMSHVSSPSCVTGRKQVAPPPLAPPRLTVQYRRLQGRFIWVRPKTSAAALGREIPQQHSSQGFQVGGGVVRAARPLRLPSERRLRTA
jgi:hypothetical protein